MRVQDRLALQEIAERLALPKTTVYYWVRDLPLGRPRRNVAHPGNRAMCEKYRKLREAAYSRGRDEFAALARDATFRDFVCMYIGEGYKRNRNRVALANSDPEVVQLAAGWIRQFSGRPLDCSIQYHADQKPADLVAFWAAQLQVDPDRIRLQRKSNSSQLRRRTWRSKHGVLTVGVNDTLLRSRLQGWIDSIREQWLDSS